MSYPYPYYYTPGIVQDPPYNDYIVTVEPIAFPLDIDEVKQQLRIINPNDKEEDPLIQAMILAVSQYVTSYTKRTLLTTTYRTFRDVFPQWIQLRQSPYQSLVSFTYLSANTNTFIPVPSNIYQITQSKRYVGIYPIPPNQFPNDFAVTKQCIVIDFKAGYGDTAVSIPKDLKMAMLNHVAYLYANRGDFSNDMVKDAVPPTARLIYDQKTIKLITGTTVG